MKIRFVEAKVSAIAKVAINARPFGTNSVPFNSDQDNH